MKKFFSAPELREETWHELLIIPANSVDESNQRDKNGYKSVGVFRTREEAMFISKMTKKASPGLIRQTHVITDGKSGIMINKDVEIFPVNVKKKYKKEFENFLKKLEATV